jgi:8-oxo-dGTP pyrophosphatase MutT (NUDIX family)/GTP-binding protein EngB required for normal cell division
MPRLDRAIAVLGASVPSESPLLARLHTLRGRFAHNRLQLAVLGQFKRGKSTFINALLGAPLLPIAVVPLTAVPTFIVSAAQPTVRVRFNDDRPVEQFISEDPDSIREFLCRFVTEEGNPENRLGVARVDLFYPAPVLADGTVLIDTPGVGSTYRHNTEAALRVLPECDAVLFVLSADPPITEVELEYLDRLKSRTARIIFVINKADQLGPEERETIVQFLRKVLSEHGLLQLGAELFSVSARNGLSAKQNGDHKGLETSGVAAVEAHLVHRLAAEKSQLLAAAIRSKAAEVLSQAEAEARLRLHALRMPLEELASKSGAFEASLESIAGQRRITRDLLNGDQRRLREDLESRVERLREEASSKLGGLIDEKVALPAGWDESAQRAISEAIEETFDAARQESTASYSSKTNAVLDAHQRRIDQLIDSVQRTAADIFDVPFAAPLEHESFALGEDPYWVTESIRASLIPDPGRLIDQVLPSRVRMRRLRARIIGQMRELVVRNAENLRWAILRGIDETFRSANLKFEEQLDGAIRGTSGVIKQAIARRRDRSSEIQPEVSRLDRAIGSLAAVREGLADRQTDGVGANPVPSMEDKECCARREPAIGASAMTEFSRKTRFESGPRAGAEPDLVMLLADPEIRLVMRADHVDEGKLLAMFNEIKVQLRNNSAMDNNRTGTSPSLGSEASQYRAGVGVILLNSRNEVFVGRRADLPEDAWQAPQGGIDEGETPRQAALRELEEEIGVDNVDVLAESRGWLYYDLPEELAGKAWGGRWKGQRQKWFVMLFKGSDTDINITTEHPEFNAWRWVPVKELTDLAVSFKRQLYLNVLGEFAALFRD